MIYFPEIFADSMKAFTERLLKKFGRVHTLRHGGCRAIYNETGDVALAGMILGNEDSDTVKVCARSDKKGPAEARTCALEES